MEFQGVLCLVSPNIPNAKYLTDESRVTRRSRWGSRMGRSSELVERRGATTALGIDRHEWGFCQPAGMGVS